eukprot:TRINITY_DN14186_c0_g1_i1.p1 TRINITY_DN14186_c0_g1~~TRINITY_DN14186_c0_g1_i1.p1  ORF type:complete len:149 (+),score=32.62 TRINITY_DN14186_c0_g1_i1:119-565(+)
MLSTFCLCCGCEKYQTSGKIGVQVEKIFRSNNSMKICCVMDTSGKVISYMADVQKSLVDSILSKVFSIKMETIRAAKELGFDTSREFTFKTDEHVTFVYDICPGSYYFVAVHEMDEITSLFFNGTKFIGNNELELLDIIKHLEEGYRY